MPTPMSISGVSAAVTGLTAAQGVLDGAVQQAADGSVPAVGVSAAAAGEAAQVALLHKALEMERSLVNILA